MGYNGRSLEFILINRIITVGSLLESMICLAIGSWSDSGARFGFHFVE